MGEVVEPLYMQKGFIRATWIPDRTAALTIISYSVPADQSLYVNTQGILWNRGRMGAHFRCALHRQPSCDGFATWQSFAYASAHGAYLSCPTHLYSGKKTSSGMLPPL